jgi:hypothetical protein
MLTYRKKWIFRAGLVAFLANREVFSLFVNFLVISPRFLALWPYSQFNQIPKSATGAKIIK